MSSSKQKAQSGGSAGGQVNIQTVTVVQNVSTDPDGQCLQQVKNILQASHNITIHVVPVDNKTDHPEVPKEAANPDLVIVLGGDGTFLRASQCFVEQKIPLVGINTGTLGFLTRIESDKIESYLSRLLAGEYRIEERMMLAVSLETQPQTLLVAANDVVVKNRNPSQMCSLNLFINDVLVSTYDADGIIIATPTGTTAYTLSAGGPVISPEVEAISITPICPHSLSAKPIVIPAGKTLRVESAVKNRPVVYSVDGQESGTLEPGQNLTLFRAPYPLKMIDFGQEGEDFYLLLKQKLHWAMNPRWKTQ
ncbi:MAG: NAD(+)/NADH kinase [Vampirovibrio sp.]|nr:NAD(+)/NADH kinase [Vampirovibrio sp.]